jgi:hypothetical protein
LFRSISIFWIVRLTAASLMPYLSLQTDEPLQNFQQTVFLPKIGVVAAAQTVF